jgi:hypothetical protein
LSTVLLFTSTVVSLSQIETADLLWVECSVLL